MVEKGLLDKGMAQFGSSACSAWPNSTTAREHCSALDDIEAIIKSIAEKMQRERKRANN